MSVNGRQPPDSGAQSGAQSGTQPANDASVRLARALDLVRSGRLQEGRTLFDALRQRTGPESLGFDAAMVWVRLCGELGMLDEGWNVATTFLAGREAGADQHATEVDLRVARARLSIRRAMEGLAAPGDMYDLAEADLRSALFSDPSHARAYAVLGLLLDRLGRAQESVEMWRCAHALAPEDIESETGLAVALSEAGRHEEALIHFERLVQDQPELAEAQVNLGIALRAANDVNGALQAFKKALQLDPGSDSARQGLLHLETKGSSPETNPNERVHAPPKLSADLSAFSVADLLGFLAVAGRSGSLLFRKPGSLGRAELIEGRLLFVDQGGSATAVELGMPPDSKNWRPWLESAGEFPPDQLERITESLYQSSIQSLKRLVTWSEGTAELSIAADVPGGLTELSERSELSELSFDAQGALLEAYRQIDEEGLRPQEPLPSVEIVLHASEGEP